MRLKCVLMFLPPTRILVIVNGRRPTSLSLRPANPLVTLQRTLYKSLSHPTEALHTRQPPLRIPNLDMWRIVLLSTSNWPKHKRFRTLASFLILFISARTLSNAALLSSQLSTPQLSTPWTELAIVLLCLCQKL